MSEAPSVRIDPLHGHSRDIWTSPETVIGCDEPPVQTRLTTDTTHGYRHETDFDYILEKRDFYDGAVKGSH